jgi:hypothetical protein
MLPTDQTLDRLALRGDGGHGQLPTVGSRESGMGARADRSGNLCTTMSTSRKALTSLKARTPRSPSLPSPSYDRGRGAGSVGDIMARLTLFQRRSPKRGQGRGGGQGVEHRWRSGPMCSTRAGRKHGEPLTRPLPTIVPCSDRDKPDGDRPRIDCRSWHVEKEPVVIKQAPVKGRNAVKVSFVLPQDAIPGKTSVVGDFNGWDPLAHPLRPWTAERH